jgi:pSer/pThr/pTyr-binding forkhead associated (FHA) protein
MPRLVCTHGNNAEEVFAIKEGVNRVGRSPDAAVKVFDNACSRAHAEIYRRGDYISIEDLGSRHGTFVNGKRIAHRVKLHLGDRIDIGHTVLKLGEGEDRVVKTAPVDPAAPLAEAQTQEISQQLLAAEMELVKQRQEHPKINLLQRLFGNGEEGNEKKDGNGAAGT